MTTEGRDRFDAQQLITNFLPRVEWHSTWRREQQLDTYGGAKAKITGFGERDDRPGWCVACSVEGEPGEFLIPLRIDSFFAAKRAARAVAALIGPTDTIEQAAERGAEVGGAAIRRVIEAAIAEWSR